MRDTRPVLLVHSVMQSTALAMTPIHVNLIVVVEYAIAMRDDHDLLQRHLLLEGGLLRTCITEEHAHIS